MNQPGNMRAGNATALAASSRYAAAPLRCAPSGDTASAAAHWLATTGRVLPVVTDRLFTTTAAAASTMPLTSSRRVGTFYSPRAQNHSEYTLFSPSDCPTNQDHLSVDWRRQIWRDELNLLSTQPNQLCREPRSGHTRLATASLTIALLSSTSTLLTAQSVRAESANVIEEIVVTARKREELLQDTPVVISALSARTISDFSIESVEDIADFTPGLISHGQGNPAGGILFLRGIGSGAAHPAIEQAVSLVVDDMQMGSLLMQKSAMIYMQAVQVYKGPQALFFGKAE